MVSDVSLQSHVTFAYGERASRMDRAEGSVALTIGDAWLLAALTEANGRAVRLRDFVHDYDWLNRAVPTFDEVSFGLPRIVARGLGSVSGEGRNLRLAATPLGLDVRRSVVGHPIPAIADAIGARDEGPEDRSRGRLPGLSQQDLADAAKAHAAWVRRWSRPFVVLASIIVWWQNRRRPRDIR